MAPASILTQLTPLKTTMPSHSIHKALITKPKREWTSRVKYANN
jgi:hypothetical protein